MMKGAGWWFSLVLAFGLVMVAAEVSPEAVNWFLLLVILGVLLARWQSFAPVLGGLTRLTGGSNDEAG